MRIIAGSLKGRKINPPDIEGLRPTMDQVRGAIFSSLGSIVDVAGRRVLDLYAGSGAMGIEAISRGAAGAVFIESSAALVKAMRDTISAFGIGAEATVIKGELPEALANLPGEPFDVVFADPPYAENVAELPGELVRRGLVRSRSVLVLETAAKRAPLTMEPGLPLFLDMKNAKSYGGSEVQYYVFQSLP